MKISVTGIGPGNTNLIPPLAGQVIQQADVIIGYTYYINFIAHLLSENQEIISKPIGDERERAVLALEKAAENRHVVVISSGDAGIYAMASLVYEEASRKNFQGQLETIPGISAFVAAAARLGAPTGHDFCCISLSDRLTPWNTIETRIKGAAAGDFVTALYNPKSEKRYWQLERLQTLYLKYRNPDTPVAIVRQVFRSDEEITITTLQALKPGQVDMFSLILIGNAQTYRFRNYLITPRGYHQHQSMESGALIQQNSFVHILENLSNRHKPKDELWGILRCIHSTGDFAYESCFESSPGAISQWAAQLQKGIPVVTDVEMVRAGISKKLLQKYNNPVYCYLNEPDIADIAAEQNTTRSKVAIERAMTKHPDALFVIGNAPTALNAIADAIKINNFLPAGVIGVPVGFVNVKESKFRLKACREVPFVLTEGNRGGSNVAAALVNAALSLEESEKYIEPINVN